MFLLFIKEMERWVIGFELRARTDILSKQHILRVSKCIWNAILIYLINILKEKVHPGGLFDFDVQPRKLRENRNV